MKKGLFGLGLACALALLLGVMIGCAGDSGGGGDEGFSAVGTYAFLLDGDGDDTPPVGTLTYTILRSSFPDDCGPQDTDVGVVATVEDLTATTIEILDLHDPDLGDVDFIGVRSPAGDLEDVVGVWVGTTNDEGIRIILRADFTLIVRAPWASCQ